MGNHKLERHQFQINTTPPIVLEMIIIETQRQHDGIGVIRSLDASITTTRVETVVVPNINVVKRGILIGSTLKLGSRSNGVSTGRNLNRSSTLLIYIIRVVHTLQMVFTNSITTTHVNKAANRPPMNSMVARGYKSADVTNPRGGY